jgi:hypothetical protein
MSGTTAATKEQTGSYVVRVAAGGSISSPVRIPLHFPLTETFFSATPRSGNRSTEAVDLLISDTQNGKPVARYARIRFCKPTSPGSSLKGNGSRTGQMLHGGRRLRRFGTFGLGRHFRLAFIAALTVTSKYRLAVSLVKHHR